MTLKQLDYEQPCEPVPGWQYLRLSDCCRLIKGAEPGRAAYNTALEGRPFYRVSDLTGKRDTLVYTTQMGLPGCDEPDILMTFDGSPGWVKRGLRGCYSSGIRTVAPLDKALLDADYLYYALQSSDIRRTILRHSTGLTVKHASKAIPHLVIPVPHIDEQRRIADCLMCMDAARKSSKTMITSTRELIGSLECEFLGNPPDLEVRLDQLKDTRLGSSAGDRRNQGGTAAIPLSDAVASIDYGLSAPIPIVQPKNGVKIVSTADITRCGAIDYWRIRRVAATGQQQARLRLHAGDVLFNWRNSPKLVGKTAVFEEQAEPCIFASFVLRIRANQAVCNNRYLEHLLNYYRGRGVFLRLSRRAVNQSNFNRNELLRLPIRLPPLDDQERIVRTLEIARGALAACENELVSLDALLKSACDSLMTGQVCLPTFKEGKQ